MIVWEASLTPMKSKNLQNPIGLGKASHSPIAAQSSLIAIVLHRKTVKTD